MDADVTRLPETAGWAPFIICAQGQYSVSGIVRMTRKA